MKTYLPLLLFIFLHLLNLISSKEWIVYRENAKRGFNDADEWCKEKGARLASISNSNEARSLEERIFAQRSSKTHTSKVCLMFRLWAYPSLIGKGAFFNRGTVRSKKSTSLMLNRFLNFLAR